MRTRRGSSYYRSEMAGLIDNFKPGDIVTPVFVNDDTFYGIVRSIDRKANSVMVAWGGGSITQHGPEEVVIHPFAISPEITKRRMASQGALITKGVIAMTEEEAEDNPQFVGDPETHGIEDPVDGGFGVMQKLVKKLRKESEEEAEEGPKVARSRRGVYYMQAPRTYRMTKSEANGNPLICPRCGAQGMEKERFLKSDKMFVCPDCRFKVPSSKLVKSPSELEVEVEVKLSSRRDRK